MDIKKSFKRFKKNYICESEVLDNEEFVDVDLEGSSKTGLDWYNEYDELGGTRTAEDIMVHDFDILSKNDWYHTDGSGQIFDHDGDEVEDWDPELEAISYDEMVDMLGTPEEAVKDDEQPGLTDDDYVDPETMLDSGYDDDFDGNESYRRKDKCLLTEALPVVNDDLDTFDRQDKYDKFIQDDDVLDTNTGDDIVYEIGIYYKKNGRQPNFTFYPDKTVRYTFDEMAEKFGSQCANDIIMNGSYDTANIYYKLEYVEHADASEINFDIGESCCCGGKKKGKKKGKKSKFVPFWAKKKDLQEALKTLKKAGYHIINERRINLGILIKDIFELLTSFGIVATDDEVEKLIRTFIESGRNVEQANAEDVLEFDIDNEPDTIIEYTGDFVDWIKKGQYETGPVD